MHLPRYTHDYFILYLSEFAEILVEWQTALISFCYTDMYTFNDTENKITLFLGMNKIASEPVSYWINILSLIRVNNEN